MWVEILKQVAGKNSKAFRFITCGRIDLREFKQKYMFDDDNSDDEKEMKALQAENKEKKPEASQLVGFVSQDNN